jgi:phenylacetate-CoA ligase
MALTGAAGGSRPVGASDYQAGFDDRIGPLVAAAADRSPGFRRRLDEAGLTAADLTDVAALDRLPILSKDQLLGWQHERPPFGDLLASDATVRRVFQSPGPLYEPETTTGDGWRWAPALRAAGFGPEDRVLVAFGFHLSPAGAMFEAACLALGATVLPAGIGSKEAQVRACVDLEVSAFIGPPSYLNALFESADEVGTPLTIQRAFVTAEPLPPSLRARLAERVGTVRQGYGTAETGLLGFECEVQEGLHVPDDALVQICDLTTGEALHDGTEGQIVTTLLSTDYPLIRFGTGDLSGWHPDPCGCGLTSPRTKGWTGRIGDAVKVKGMFLHPRQVEQVMARLTEVTRYQVTVDRPEHTDRVRCEVVADGDGQAVTSKVAEAMRDSLRFSVDVQAVSSLPEDAPTFVDERTWD